MPCLSYSSEIKIWDIINVVITATGISCCCYRCRRRRSKKGSVFIPSLTPQSVSIGCCCYRCPRRSKTIPQSVSIQKRLPQEEMNRQEELADMLKTTFVEAIRRALRSAGEEGLDADSKIARVYEFIEEALELEASRRNLSVETILASML